MENLQILDNILLSKNVVKKFYDEYEGNIDFKNWLDEILPEVELSKNQTQNNPWHLYNVLDHILHAVEYMSELSEGLNEKDRRLLAYTMFFHDLGKPACRTLDEKEGKVMDRFFEHNIASEKVVNRAIKNFNFNEEESKIIAKLVHDHDIFLHFYAEDSDPHKDHYKKVDENLINELIKKFNSIGDGTKILDFLVLVGKADARAHTPENAKSKFKIFDKIDEFLKC